MKNSNLCFEIETSFFPNLTF